MNYMENEVVQLRNKLINEKHTVVKFYYVLEEE